ncbi:hypothetical protein FFLO_04953 [Filobasidium floriforme]|uniref:EXPERA domain-containing protein n=1 Tax=Filobasidium floriforme TaxID=5210 RepID=A0A8K0JHY5_9TREE|nr:hypothetical protein FFLO_04953 [Filobasidium floriforme]
MDRTPLSSRPLDKLWFLWFVFSQPLTAVIDGQAIYPRHLVPGFIRSLYLQALEFSKDTLMLGMEKQDPSLFWFKGFICLEVFFQLPLFFVGAYCLYYSTYKRARFTRETGVARREVQCME